MHVNSLADVAGLDPLRLRTPSRVRTAVLGGVRLSYVADGWIQLNPRVWFADSGPDFWDRHREYLDDEGFLRVGAGGLLVERDGRALLIDTGFGPREVAADPAQPRTGAACGGRLLDSLAALGRAPADVDTVAITHMHRDHIGWVAAPAPDTGVPPFAHARAVLTKAEWDHGCSRREAPFPETVVALEPRLDLADDGDEVFPGVRLLATPGHTPGHAAYEITAGEETVIAFGDLFHSPLQIGHPEWSPPVDVDPETTARHRRALVDRLATPGTYGFGIHFADVAFGRVRQDEGGRRAWQPVVTEAR
ncbi:MBL fold metallo-hydrolase [Amycolatopsis thermalba]|uniref:MBL fold metallo-hydrolase n=1 Tax=Amycolatopsis thermalba TaxID=944492 RepID=A0ABY4NY12_9PSEU|nr:MBL fold metallo-hydrolase [Amycolatopsis thermalba]UQS24959.1 MBL fold metallo-hydrolase [Amycolatopsis thermalba]